MKKFLNIQRLIHSLCITSGGTLVDSAYLDCLPITPIAQVTEWTYAKMANAKYLPFSKK